MDILFCDWSDWKYHFIQICSPELQEVCLGPFQKFLEILTQSQAKIPLMVFYETQVSDSNNNFSLLIQYWNIMQHKDKIIWYQYAKERQLENNVSSSLL